MIPQLKGNMRNYNLNETKSKIEKLLDNNVSIRDSLNSIGSIYLDTKQYLI